MENAEEIQLVLERYSRLKPKEIPEQLEEYMTFVAKTGDTVFKWPLIQHLFREKLLNVITEFHDRSNSIMDLPHYPNVDPFNFDLMKKNLIERMESFCAAPFTIQRICELLTEPRKQYSRIDKFMRAIEKNILVVSTTEPGRTRHESENGESLDSTVNGDLMSEGNVDVGSSEEEQSTTETPAAAAATEDSNGTEKPPTTTEKTATDTPAAENPDNDVPLEEKLEPEVNVLTLDTAAELPAAATETSADEKDSTAVKPTENVPETSVVVEESATKATEDAPKPEETVVDASPSKRSSSNDGDTEIPTDESVSKKAKVDETPEEDTSEQIPAEVTNSNATESAIESQTQENPVLEPAVEPKESVVVAAPEVQEEIQPLPPIETIQQQEAAMEPEPVVEPVTVVAATEEEDAMKVDAAMPLVVSAENKMQTDEMEETAASAMDIDECSADFIME